MIASEEKTFHVPDRQYRLASTGEEDSVRSHKRKHWMELFGKSA